MAKNAVEDWSTTASANTDIGGINVDEGCPAPNLNNAVREVMAQIAALKPLGAGYAQTFGDPDRLQARDNIAALARDGSDIGGNAPDFRENLGLTAKVQTFTSGGHTAVAADRNNVLIFTTNAQTLALTAAATLGSDWFIDVVAYDAAVTIDPNSTETVDGAATLVVPAGRSCRIWCDGTGFRTNLIGGLNLVSPVATTSGTEVGFTGIPAWVRRITIKIAGMSTNGTSPPIIQLGDSGGYETSGYLGSNIALASGVTAVNNFTTGFGIGVNTSNWGAATTVHGAVALDLLDPANNTWVASGNLGSSNNASAYTVTGSKSLSAVLDRVRITMSNGSDTFDAGLVGLSYE